MSADQIFTQSKKDRSSGDNFLKTYEYDKAIGCYKLAISLIENFLKNNYPNSKTYKIKIEEDDGTKIPRILNTLRSAKSGLSSALLKTVSDMDNYNKTKEKYDQAKENDDYILEYLDAEFLPSLERNFTYYYKNKDDENAERTKNIITELIKNDEEKEKAFQQNLKEYETAKAKKASFFDEIKQKNNKNTGVLHIQDDKGGCCNCSIF